MTSSKLLLPLRVPELGPQLGKVVTGTRRRPGGLQLDAIRYRLATRVFEAAGEARRLASREERSSVLEVLGRAAWLGVWQEAVSGVADLVATHVAQRLDEEARRVRMPERRRRRQHLDAADRRALAARLGSAGAGLMPALDRIESAAELARGATPIERAAVAQWQEALKTAARRLEAAWLALEDATEREVGRWEAVAAEIARWRKPLWPVLLVGAPALGAAAWLGLVLGGYLPPPPWLARLWQLAFG